MPLHNPLYLGTAYYPEQWPEERWPEDARLMKAAGINVARMAEFAWSTLEPEPGLYCFDWLDKVIEVLALQGISTVLGTPTAAPPAWLVQLHPEILPIDEHGQQVQFGNRCHYCVNSPAYHQEIRRMVSAMARHFGPNPHIIGWQIDNEYNRVCYCDQCRGIFQQYLKEKYQTLSELNSRWTTGYWSQTYSGWEQIPIPIGPHNPGLMMEFKRFITASYRNFQKLQLNELCPHLRSGVWTTHNFMGWYDGFDHYEMSADLEMAAWDWYVGSGHNDFPASGMAHDLTRGFKRKNYWVIETQAGNVNWSTYNNMLDKGEGRSMAWQAIAHGADAVNYWQWRSASNGQEQLHGTLVDPRGFPRLFYDEARQIGDEFKTLSPLIAGSQPLSMIAMINSYESRWAVGWQPHHKDFDYVKHFAHYYHPLAVRGLNIDILDANGITNSDQLSGYRLLIAPALAVLHPELVTALDEFVESGGCLVLTIRCGQKDRYNALLPSRQPGPFSKIAGVEVEEYYSLSDPAPVKGEGWDGQSTIWAERLKLMENAQPVARFGKSNGWLDEQVAIARCGYGKGVVYTVGAYLDAGSQNQLVKIILNDLSIPWYELPDGVEIRTRVRSEGDEIYFLINHNTEETAMTLPWNGFDHLSGRRVEGELRLAPYGIAILTKIKTTRK